MRVANVAAASDPGRKRRHNEDAYVVEPPLFAVADGMGGAQAGEVASRLAAGALKEGRGAIEELIQEANRRVHQRSIEDPDASGMGTTMTVAVVEDGIVRIGHVGDSRLYLVRNGELEQLTQDHSLVGELVRSGKLSPQEAEHHPQRSVITRAVGTDPDVDVDTFTIEPHDGDVFLICSDGLTDMVDDTTIRELVAERRDLDGLVKALIKAANRSGGDDNITVVAFEISAEDATLDETQTLPSADATAAHDPDEEDTLTEADRVPAVETMVVSADEIAAAYEDSKQPARKRRRGSRFLSFLLVLLVLVALGFFVLWGLVR